MKIGLQTWGSDGDIRPFIALAGGLSEFGHEVSLVITSVDNKDYSSFGEKMGFSVTHVGKLDYSEDEIRMILAKIIGSITVIGQVEALLKSFFNPVISEMFAASTQLCADNDLIIGHFMDYPVAVAAEKAAKPYITITLNHSSIYSRYSVIYGFPDFGKWMNPFWWKLINLVLERYLMTDLNKLRKQEQLPPTSEIADKVLTSPLLNLLAVSPAICQRKPDWPENQQICGFLEIPKSREKWSMPGDLKKFIESGSPPVFITIGSMISLDPSPGLISEIFVQATLLAGCRAIIQSRWDELPDFPDHPEIFKIGKVPHTSIFPHCSAVVHHGGAGTTHSATASGCPSVVIEHFADQAFFAGELLRLGVAPKVLHRRNITARKIARALKLVKESPGMKMRAEELGRIMQKENGVKRAVELIEERFPNNMHII